MKARIERERIPPGEDPQFHLKLGRGSLSDVEFLVQLLQLEHGGDTPRAARPRHDRRARTDCATRHCSTATTRRRSKRAYRFCERARNALYLHTGRPSDALPADVSEIERLGRLLGYVHQPRSRRCATTTAGSPGAPGASSSACSTRAP